MGLHGSCQHGFKCLNQRSEVSTLSQIDRIDHRSHKAAALPCSEDHGDGIILAGGLILGHREVPAALSPYLVNPACRLRYGVVSDAREQAI